jgi:hypothetical protein
MSARCFTVVAVVAPLLVVAGCRKPVDPREEKLMTDLSVMATGRAPSASELTSRADDLRAGKLKIEEYVDTLLAQKMNGRLARDVVLGATMPVKDRHPLPVHSVLKAAGNGDDKIYYLRSKCDREAAEKVKAWWGEEVLVCPDSHRPTVLGDGQGKMCGSSMLDPRDTDVCGCGPELMYCTKNDDHYQKTQDSFQRELIDTAAHVVDGNLPIEQLFTMNETVRTDIGEMMYRRARVAAGEKISLIDDSFEKSPRLAPRKEMIPGQHAGLLTTPSMTYASDALRGVMRNTYDYLWCTGVPGARVSTQSILDLKAVDLRVGEGWKDLAAMNVCTDCHARLDYGMQFFWGYPSSTAGVDFRPELALKGKGPLYLRDIRDERGSDDLTPAGFARLATSQPEFGDCMTRRIVDHVFNGTETSADFDAVRKSFEATHRMKSMLRVAMVRYAERERSGKATSAPARAGDSIVREGGRIKVSARLHEMLEESCKECHKAGRELDVTVASFDRDTLLHMLDSVGFGAMPKGAAGLDDAARKALVDELARHVFVDDHERAIATAWFQSGVRGLPVHRFASAMSVVKARVGDGDKGWRPSAVETATPQGFISYSPAIALSSAVTAARSCRENGLKDAEYEACVERASSPTAVIAGRLGP